MKLSYSLSEHLHYLKRAPSDLRVTVTVHRNKMEAPIKKSSIRICHQCDKDIYPRGKILFDDQFARQDGRGNWHCSDCMKEAFNSDLTRLAPNSLAAKEITAQRKRREEFKVRYQRVRRMSGERLSYNDTGLKKYT